MWGVTKKRSAYCAAPLLHNHPDDLSAGQTPTKGCKSSSHPVHSHVNKKALDQYVNFSEQRDALMRRRDESEAAEAKISDLIKILDMRKDDAIERTFKVSPADLVPID